MAQEIARDCTLFSLKLVGVDEKEISADIFLKLSFTVTGGEV